MLANNASRSTHIRWTNRVRTYLNEPFVRKEKNPLRTAESIAFENSTYMHKQSTDAEIPDKVSAGIGILEGILSTLPKYVETM